MARLPQEFRGTERFEIRRRIGGGGNGVVYAAWDREKKQLVALKTLLKLSPAALYRFKREFRALADVRHPHLVSLYELFSDGGTWFFTMELIEGETFLTYVRKTPAQIDQPTKLGDELADDDATLILEEPPASETEAPRLDFGRLRDALAGLGEGLQALHDAGKLHRDIKPSNVLITTKGRPVVLDFGLATDLGDDSLARSQLGQVVGTMAYMAPEQAAGQPLSRASDWYSVGVMLYQALTGRLPFYGSIYKMLLEKQEKEPPSPDQITPGLPPELVKLAVELLRQKPEDRPKGPEVLRRLGKTNLTSNRRSSNQFFGRERELRVLEEAFRATADGHPVVVHVTGPSDIGKTALVRRFLGDLEADDRALVFGGRCYAQELLPFKTLDNLVDQLTNHLTSLSEAEQETLLPRETAALARVFQVLERLGPVQRWINQGNESPDPVEVRRRAFSGFRALLGALVRHRPVVLSLDDVQWGDADSASMLAELLRPKDAPAVVLLAAYTRREDLPRSLDSVLHAEHLRGVQVVELPLGPLEPLAAQAMAQAVLSPGVRLQMPLDDDETAPEDATLIEAPQPPARAQAIAKASGGKPAHILELAHPTRAEAGPITGRTTITGLAQQRIDGLGAAAKALLEVISLSPRPLERKVALTAAGAREEVVQQLVSADLVQERATDLEPSHEGVRDAVLSRMPLELQRARHRALAAALERLPERQLHHLRDAGDRERAARAAREAAQKSLDALAFEQAAELARLALELESDEAARYQICRERAEALESAGRPEAAEAYLEAAAKAPTRLGSLEMQRRAAEQYLRTGRVDEGIVALEKVLAAFGDRLPANPEQALAVLRVERASVLMRELHLDDQPPINDREKMLQADVCWTASVGLTMVDTVIAALYTTRYLALALALRDPNRLARALAMELAYLTSEGQKSVSRLNRVLAELRALAKRIDAPYVRGFSTLGAGMAAVHEGEWQQASRCAESAENMLKAECSGVDWEVDTARTFGLWASAYCGNFTGLADKLEELIREAKSRGNLYAASILRMSAPASLIWLVEDTPEVARRHLVEAQKDSRTSRLQLRHFWEICTELQLELYAGEGRRAWTRISSVWRSLEDALFTRVQVLRVEALYLRARAALAANIEAPQRPLLSAARQDAEALLAEDVRWTKPLGQLMLAMVNAAMGLRSEAIGILETAERGFLSTNLLAHAAVARLRLGQLQGATDGEALAQAAWEDLAARGVVNPERFAALLAPMRK